MCLSLYITLTALEPTFNMSAFMHHPIYGVCVKKDLIVEIMNYVECHKDVAYEFHVQKFVRWLNSYMTTAETCRFFEEVSVKLDELKKATEDLELSIMCLQEMYKDEPLASANKQLYDTTLRVWREKVDKSDIKIEYHKFPFLIVGKSRYEYIYCFLNRLFIGVMMYKENKDKVTRFFTPDETIKMTLENKVVHLIPDKLYDMFKKNMQK